MAWLAVHHCCGPYQRGALAFFLLPRPVPPALFAAENNIPALRATPPYRSCTSARAPSPPYLLGQQVGGLVPGGYPRHLQPWYEQEQMHCGVCCVRHDVAMDVWNMFIAAQVLALSRLLVGRPSNGGLGSTGWAACTLFTAEPT